MYAGPQERTKRWYKNIINMIGKGDDTSRKLLVRVSAGDIREVSVSESLLMA